ncbi:hypothetical protein, partial [Reichenbachiella sp.]
MEAEKLNIIFYVFIVIFSITAIITFLGITNVIKSMNAKYLNGMFAALILEVVAAVILSYKQIDFTCQTEEVVMRLTKKTTGIPENSTMEERISLLETRLSENENSDGKVGDLNRKVASLEEALSNCQQTEGTANDEISTLDKVFYSNVIKLRIVADKFRG